MPAFFLLLVMSLVAGSNQARDKPRPPKVAVNQGVKKADASKTPPIANDKTVASEKIAVSVSLSDAATPPPAISIIEAEAKELSMQSEIDAPIIVKYWASQKTELSPGEVAALVEQQADKPIEIVTVAAFFKNSALVEDWMNDDEKALALKFQKFIVTLETQLENPQVYLFGERERTVVIIGKVKGGFGGVATVVVET